MNFIYNLIAHIAWFLLKLAAYFSSKLRLFVAGRKETFAKLRQSISESDSVIWIHAASLGEFEQGLPIIEKLKIAYPSNKILVTFFSPSGYEIKKDTPIADLVTYLPIDTKKNVQQFIQLAQPKLAIFIKYEIWPNYLKELDTQKIPILLTSAIFKKDQVYFKWYGGFMRNAAQKFTHIFVQNEASKKRLASIEIKNTSIVGDTRLDRVFEILKSNNALSFMDDFKSDKSCVVAGSTWPEDENILVKYINQAPENIRFVIAPHAIKKEGINSLKTSISKKTMLHSEIAKNDLSNYQVLIIDTIGLLTKIYSYADLAYVGGGFNTGLHNTLEPAVFGIPVLIGPNYKGFQEAEDLVSQGGILAIEDAEHFDTTLNDLLNKTEICQKIGAINTTYILKNKGASIRIMERIRTLL